MSASSLSVGDTREMVLVDDLTRTQIVQYAGASGDYNPLHTDEKFTREVAGYPGVFAHGMLTMGMTGRLLTDWVGDGRLTKYGVRFSKQVWPGDTLTATATIDADPRGRRRVVRRPLRRHRQPGGRRGDQGQRHRAHRSLKVPEIKPASREHASARRTDAALRCGPPHARCLPKKSQIFCQPSVAAATLYMGRSTEKKAWPAPS